MPRSERCRIRGNCLDGNALPSRAQPPAGAERLTAAERPSLLEHPRRLIGPERAEEGARDCGRVWASGREPSARPRGSWRGHGRGAGGRATWAGAGRRSAALLLWRLLRWPPAATEHPIARYGFGAETCSTAVAVQWQECATSGRSGPVSCSIAGPLC